MNRRSEPLPRIGPSVGAVTRLASARRLARPHDRPWARAARGLRLLRFLAVLFFCARGAAAQSLAYPATRRDTMADDYHGIRIADPYRWLERIGDPETVEWVDAQSRLTHDYLERIDIREAIRRRLAALWNYRRTGVPWREAGRLFFVETGEGRHRPALYVQDSLNGAARMILDTEEISPDGALAVGDFSVSADGRWLAYSVSPGGADIGELRLRELGTGREIGDVVRGTFGTPCWTYDGRGFFYMRPPAPEPDASSDAPRVEKQLFYHVRGQPQAQDRMLGEWKDNYR